MSTCTEYPLFDPNSSASSSASQIHDNWTCEYFCKTGGGGLYAEKKNSFCWHARTTDDNHDHPCDQPQDKTRDMKLFCCCGDEPPPPKPVLSPAPVPHLDMNDGTNAILTLDYYHELQEKALRLHDLAKTGLEPGKPLESASPVASITPEKPSPTIPPVPIAARPNTCWMYMPTGCDPHDTSGSKFEARTWMQVTNYSGSKSKEDWRHCECNDSNSVKAYYNTHCQRSDIVTHFNGRTKHSCNN